MLDDSDASNDTEHWQFIDLPTDQVHALVAAFGH